MKVTYGDNANKKVLKLDDVVSIKAANGEGEAIIEELHKFGNNQKGVFQRELMYIPEQKAWLNSAKNVFVLFNIAKSDEDQGKAVSFVSSYLNQDLGKKAKSYPNTTGGIITTDTGVALVSDDSKALRVHESHEKNQVKK